MTDTAPASTWPVTLDDMHRAVDRLLADDAKPLTPDELRKLTLQLRGHLQLLIPEVDSAARRLHRDSISRCCSLACVGEARRKLESQPSPRYGDDIGHARRLARVLRALCDHHTALQGTAS